MSTEPTNVNVSVIAPVQIRFLDPADVAAYGDGWHLYDEAALVRLPARQLVALEQACGYSVRTMMAELRRHTVMGDLLVAWCALYLEDPALAGNFEDFTPLTFAIEWRRAEFDDLGKGDAPSPEGPTATPTVALASLPAAG